MYEAIQEESVDRLEEALGETLVTLIIQAEMWGLQPTKCLYKTYRSIKNNKGKMRDGIFYKNE